MSNKTVLPTCFCALHECHAWLLLCDLLWHMWMFWWFLWGRRPARSTGAHGIRILNGTSTCLTWAHMWRLTDTGALNRYREESRTLTNYTAQKPFQIITFFLPGQDNIRFRDMCYLVLIKWLRIDFTYFIAKAVAAGALEEIKASAEELLSPDWCFSSLAFDSFLGLHEAVPADYWVAQVVHLFQEGTLLLAIAKGLTYLSAQFQEHEGDTMKRKKWVLLKHYRMTYNKMLLKSLAL